MHVHNVRDFLQAKLDSEINAHWVVPEKSPHPPLTDGILEILPGGGVKDSGNPGEGGGGLNLKKSSAGSF